MSEAPYPIGTPDVKWTAIDVVAWKSIQTIKRSYKELVITKIEKLSDDYSIEQYGTLSIDPDRYPLFILKSKQWDDYRSTILVTGGVHGYETSGVMGALRFAEQDSTQHDFNIVIAPCVSPWGFETINRWNSLAIDPNRSFYESSPAEESVALMQCIEGMKLNLIAHFDLHETTDTDNTEFRPALAARDAEVHDNWNIPDGFYAVGHSIQPQFDFQTAVIAEVKKVTHIAPADDNGLIIGEKLEQEGVINYAARELGLCMGFTEATYVTTTEVYPDSPKSDEENCILAQVAAITGGINYIKASKKKA